MDFSQECQIIGAVLSSFSKEEQDAAMEYCDEVYLSRFQAGDFTAQSDPEMRDELIAYLSGESVMYDEDEEEISFPSREDAEKIVDGGQVFVWLVTYKGEGEGFCTKEEAAGLRIFRGKWDYV